MGKLSQMNRLLFLKARLLRSLARLHSRASFKKAKQGDLFIKLCGAGLARGPYDIISLKFSHEVCYTMPWIFIGQIMFMDVVDGHYCKANSCMSSLLMETTLLMTNVEPSPDVVVILPQMFRCQQFACPP